MVKLLRFYCETTGSGTTDLLCYASLTSANLPFGTANEAERSSTGARVPVTLRNRLGARERAPGNRPSTTTSKRARRTASLSAATAISTLAPAFDALYTSPSTYLWGLAADAQGNAYAAAGSPARVYKLTPDGKASIIFAPQELQVQALVVERRRRDLCGYVARWQGVQDRSRRPNARQGAGEHTHYCRDCGGAGRREAQRCRREVRARRWQSIPVTAPASSSTPRQSTFGRWRSIARGIFTSGRAIAARFSA